MGNLAQQEELNAKRIAEWEAFEKYKAQYDGLVFKATVVSGSKGATEFLVRGLNGEGQYWVYACNIKGAKTWYAETACVYLKTGDEVEVKLTVFTDQTFATVLTKGYFDEEQWNSLDHSTLAFKVSESGELESGLIEGATL